jgi:hypothetical protein
MHSLSEGAGVLGELSEGHDAMPPVRLCHSPQSSFHDSLVATDKVVMAVLFGV